MTVSNGRRENIGAIHESGDGGRGGGGANVDISWDSRVRRSRRRSIKVSSHKRGKTQGLMNNSTHFALLHRRGQDIGEKGGAEARGGTRPG